MDINLNNVAKADETATALSNKVDKVTGKGLSTEDYTTLEKTKLSGVQSGAEVNVQSDWNQTDNAQDDYIKNKPLTSSFSGSLFSFFLFAGASDISGYKKALTSPSSGAAQNSTVTASNGENTIVKFATELNYPNQDFLNSGFFKIHFHASKSSGSGNVKIYAKIYKRDLAGIETLITTTSLTASELTTSIVDYNCEVYKSTISDLLTTDRIVIEFIAVNSGGGSPMVTLFYENGYDSRFDIPVTAVDPNLFERTENKTSTITGNETSTVKFPVVKAILDFFTGSKIRELLGVTTLSGNNTGDQDLSGLQPTLVSGTNIKTLNGNSILGSGDLVVSSGGVFGISNSSGVYTYYSNLTLAMAAATAGQTIEMFADYTETGAVTITLKNNVKVNGNRHTYTCTSSGVNLRLFTIVSGATCYLNNMIINHTSSHGNSATLYLFNGSVNLEGTILMKDAGYMVQNQGGTIYKGTYIGTLTATGCLNQGGTFLYPTAICVNGYALQNVSGETHFGYGKTTGSGIAIVGNSFYNCNAFSSSGIGAQLNGSCTNVIAYSSGGVGGYCDNGKYTNITFISGASFGCQIGQNGAEFNNFRFISTANLGMFTQFCSGNIYNNGFVQSSVTNAMQTNSADIYNNVYFKSTYNNANGNSIYIQLDGNIFTNCYFEVLNASANCIYSIASKSVKYIRSSFKGATTPVNANITQGQTNVEDSQGNIIVN